MIHLSYSLFLMIALLVMTAVTFYRGVEEPRLADWLSLAASLAAVFGTMFYFCIERACLPGGTFIAIAAFMVSLFALLLPPSRAKAMDSYAHRLASVVLCVLAGGLSWLSPVLT